MNSRKPFIRRTPFVKPGPQPDPNQTSYSSRRDRQEREIIERVLPDLTLISLDEAKALAAWVNA